MAVGQEPNKHPNAGKAMRMGMMLPGAKAKPEMLVGTRRKINQIGSDDKAEAAALKNVKSGFDEFVNWAFHEQLMSGSSAIINEWREVAEKSPRLWSKLVPKSEPAAESMASALERRGPVAAASWLFGASALGSSSGVAKVAEKLKERSKSGEGWAALRGAMWARMLSHVPDPEGGPTPRGIAETITNFIGGRGSPVSSTLFSPQERETMRRFGNTLRLAEIKSTAGKPAHLISQAQQMLQPIAQGITSALGGAVSPQWLSALVAAFGPQESEPEPTARNAPAY